jgi:L,D-peptidoglycan transpeptidase YkuD (ErfK/YbiS/YcfS/YnhG family)
MDLVVTPDGWLRWNGRRARCALGFGGVETSKREGDGVTPVGNFPLREVFFRPDRVEAPKTALPVRAITPEDGWCDDPASPDYNRHIGLPHPARHERLWREDGVYDLLVVLGYNDAPVVRGAGSAIFLHLARPGFTPTEGCVALEMGPLRDIVELCGPTDRICVSARRK